MKMKKHIKKIASNILQKTKTNSGQSHEFSKTNLDLAHVHCYFKVRLDEIHNKIWKLILFFLLYSTLNNVQQISEDT